MYPSLSEQNKILNPESTLDQVNILGSPITIEPLSRQLASILQWAQKRLSKVVCIVNTYTLVEAYSKPEFRLALCSADLVTVCDPFIAKVLRAFGHRKQPDVCAMDLFVSLCELAAREKVPIFLLGSQGIILSEMQSRLRLNFPGIQIVGAAPLAFCPTSISEDTVLTQQINDSGAGLVLVSLGCQHQELWMVQHQSKVQGVMIGLGSVFPQYVGLIKQKPPVWVSAWKLEYLFNVQQVLWRLWLRYASALFLFIQSWFKHKSRLASVKPVLR
jgi:N-acetylglucosaminyldiphosphoundecaprenol N-acetyl-beta-D-mannosaminyltransferase